MTYKDKLIDLLKSDDETREAMEKLEFGCKILYGDKNFPRELTIDRYQSYIECGCRKGKSALSAITGWRCETKGCINHGTSGSSSIPKICEECSRKKNKCQFCGAYLEIIGLPLQECFLRMYCDNEKIDNQINNSFIFINGKIVCELNNRKDFDYQNDIIYQKIYEALYNL